MFFKRSLRRYNHPLDDAHFVSRPLGDITSLLSLMRVHHSGEKEDKSDQRGGEEGRNLVRDRAR